MTPQQIADYAMEYLDLHKVSAEYEFGLLGVVTIYCNLKSCNLYSGDDKFAIEYQCQESFLSQ